MVVIFMMNLLLYVSTFNHLILFCNLYRHNISFFSYKVTLYQLIILLFVINF